LVTVSLLTSVPGAVPNSIGARMTTRIQQHRALRLLANAPHGRTVAGMLAHGFTNALLDRLARDGLATVQPGTICHQHAADYRHLGGDHRSRSASACRQAAGRVTHRASHPRRSGHVRMRGWGALPSRVTGSISSAGMATSCARSIRRATRSRCGSARGSCAGSLIQHPRSDDPAGAVRATDVEHRVPKALWLGGRFLRCTAGNEVGIRFRNNSSDSIKLTARIAALPTN
jgi:hypothetical protein